MGAAFLSLSACMDEATLSRAGVSGIEGKDFVSLSGKSTIGTDGHWNSTLDTFAWVLTVVNVDGMAAVCGVQSNRVRERANLMTRMMGDMHLSINGTKVVQGFQYFTKVADARLPDAGPATCKRSNVPWVKGMESNRAWDIGRRGDGRYRL